MKFSIIIPVYNARDYLRNCLDAIFSSERKDFEIIIVDNKSTDASLEIITTYSCRLIQLDKNKGAAHARNIGRTNAIGEILVFIDADVVIKANTLEIIDETFKSNPNIVAVTGLLSRVCPHDDFFSQYKNLYMHYIFKKCPRYVDFLYGSLMAIKREHYLPFNESLLTTEDTELGQRYKTLKKPVLLNPELEVIHYKKYTLIRIIKNDFLVPFWWSKSFISHKGFFDIIKKGRFSHARGSQIISVVTSYVLIFVVFFFHQYNPGIISFLLILNFIYLNRNFFVFLYREKGFVFALGAAIFTFFDCLIMGLGILSGLLYFIGKNKRIRASVRPC